MRRLAAVGLAAATVIGATLIGAPASGSMAQFAGVRQATASLHTVAAAEGAGYEKFLPCFDSPAGGMGQHYADLESIDGSVDANHPEVLVFEPYKNQLRLVAVEYVVPQGAWTGAHPPSLFGEDFHRNDTLGIWALHAWIWRPNPDGVHADFNPHVALCG
ncbi:MAG: hypothetical protein ABI720_06775 [Actinomycetes bacterium]